MTSAEVNAICTSIGELKGAVDAICPRLSCIDDKITEIGKVVPDVAVLQDQAKAQRTTNGRVVGSIGAIAFIVFAAVVKFCFDRLQKGE